MIMMNPHVTPQVFGQDREAGSNSEFSFGIDPEQPPASNMPVKLLPRFKWVFQNPFGSRKYDSKNSLLFCFSCPFCV